MIGVANNGTSYTYEDNWRIMRNTSTTESTLHKKNNIVCYHTFKESVAMGGAITM